MEKHDQEQHPMQFQDLDLKLLSLAKSSAFVASLPDHQVVDVAAPVKFQSCFIVSPEPHVHPVALAGSEKVDVTARFPMTGVLS